ncbi:kelch-like protein 33 isoform X1 [Brachionichthys hirsutus]|uniref:kelch-like protein 33 isoform X1 n=1 Tax=Brachionichthys hirsutus TaxID=412623 RepID=UPI003605020E
MASPGFKQWEEWKSKMEVTRRERASRWAEVQVSYVYGEEEEEAEAGEMGEGEVDGEAELREAQETARGESKRVEEERQVQEDKGEDEEEEEAERVVNGTRKDHEEEDGEMTGARENESGSENESRDEDEEVDSTDGEEAAGDADSDGENVFETYRHDDYLADLFGTLKRFRDATVLTDLTLSTEDGTAFHVHALVMAPVSFRIRESLGGQRAENERQHEGVDGWSIPLGPGVDCVGLEAVVAFAYTGLIARLDKDTVRQIKAAAETLRAPRVLERCCAMREDNSTQRGRQKREDAIAAQDEMAISFQAIRRLWTDGVGCDVILEALGGSLQAHRVILAVWSGYFRSMFTLGMRESRQPSVALPFLLASELEVLIGCSYGGGLPLSWKCVFEMTSTALQLQFDAFLSLCLRFLQQEINPQSCLDVASFAEAYGMTPLLEVAEDFVLRQFQKVSRTSKFTDLPAEKLLKYLNSRSLCVSSELVVFEAVVAWLQAKPERRLKLAKELMRTVHFSLMTFREFKEVQSQNIWSEHHLKELFEEILHAFCADGPTPQSQCRVYLPKETLVLVGGDQTSEDLSSRRISGELWFGNSLRNHTGIRKAMEWRKLGEMPDTPRFGHEATVLKGQLYVFGGKKYYGSDDTLDSVYRYDPLRDSWEGLAPMLERRCYFSGVVLDEKIYAIGGLCDPDYTETVEQYCPVSNSWRYTCPIYLPQGSHVARVLRGKIFVSGGLIGDSHCLSTMFQYHPETGSTYLADMAKPRAHHCMEILGECLYVAGGVTVGNGVQIVDLLSCEAYDPMANCWTAFPSLPVPHVGAGSAVLEGKFYVLGGYSYEDYSDTTMIHRYDPNARRWENTGKTPGPNNDIRAALLFLPTHLRM